MGTREALRARDEVDNEDIDDIIGIAQDLQLAREDADDDATVEEVRAVADELDIDPSLVDQAIEILYSQREAAAQAEAEAQVEAEESRARSRTVVLIGGGVLAAVVVGVLLVGVGTGWSGAASIDRAEAKVEQAEVALDVVLDRQASLVPQLVALAGADASELQPLADAVRQAPDTDARLEASERLGVALSTSLGSMPSGTNPASAQQRLDLQHEIVGAQNRITTERRRLQSARAELDRTRRAMSGRVADGLGF